MAARITRANSAPGYFPPLHEGVQAWRLQGHEAGPTRAFWVGRSLYAPGGSASRSPAAQETVYVVVRGELVLAVEDGEGNRQEVLRPGDSVHLPKGTTRSLTNSGAAEAEIIVIIANPPEVTG